MAHPRLVAMALFTVLIAAGLFLAPPTAVAYHTGPIKAVASEVSENVTLPRNNYTGYTFSLGKGDRIVYDVRVTSGRNIDVYIVSATELGFYRSDSGVRFYWLDAVEAQTVITGVFEATAQTVGADTLIVDNVDFSGAQPYGPVNVSINLRREAAPGPSPWVLGGAVIAVGIGVAILVLLILLSRRKSPSVRDLPSPYRGPPIPYGSPMPPSQPPPQGPKAPPPAPP